MIGAAFSNSDRAIHPYSNELLSMPPPTLSLADTMTDKSHRYVSSPSQTDPPAASR